MAQFETRELSGRTWPDFARLAEKHHGVWGGCWCIAFHLRSGASGRTVAQNRADKERLVRAHAAHAALVYDGPDVVGWCQFGSLRELPARLTRFHRLGETLPDWRITCFFVDRDRRGEGVARTALAGALRMIAARGGGIVDGYPISTRGQRTSNSFLWSGTSSMFEEAEFRRLAPLGESKSVMRRVIRARPSTVRRRRSARRASGSRPPARGRRPSPRSLPGRGGGGATGNRDAPRQRPTRKTARRARETGHRRRPSKSASGRRPARRG
jgi:GNAT superfamily N-acetyltransferase